MNQVRCGACAGGTDFTVATGVPNDDSLVLTCCRCGVSTVFDVGLRLEWRRPSDFGGLADESRLKSGALATDLAFPVEPE